MNLFHSAKQHFIPALDVRSVVLVAALALGASSAAHAQSSATYPSAKPAATPTQVAPSEASSPSANSQAGTTPAQMAPSEATAAVPAKATTKELEAAFKQTDTNGDKKLSLQEAEAFPGLPQRFQQIDTDKDTFISSKEFMKAAGG